MKRVPLLLISFGFSLIILGLTVSLFNPVMAAPTARLATTPNDFLMPGTQPNQLIDPIEAPPNCNYCHNDYAFETGQDPQTETLFAWMGSMMAQSGRDPLFWAALDVANADAANSGEFCLRCHVPRGWLAGRSSAPDGSDLELDDLEGVQCLVCHRMVDPTYTAENPPRDLDVLATLTMPLTVIAPNLLLGSGTMIVDPLDHRRGPLVITDVVGFDPHVPTGAEATLTSPYHRDSAFCGTCHDISNPLFTWDENSQQFVLNPLDQPGDLNAGFPIERTYSEWFLSEYNTPGGVFAPQFGGNKQFVSTCQDCHMRDVTGVGGVPRDGEPVELRSNMALHDLTGANTWVPQIIPMHPVFSETFALNPERVEALEAGVQRARSMLQNAATVSATRQGVTLTVTVVNETGHKLPTGYPEGRRMWLQVEGYDAAGNLVYVSGAYDPQTAVLTPTADLHIYEVKQGVTEDLAAGLDGIEPGPTFHFALNNTVISDNRIPPRGYTFADFAAVGAAPVTEGQPDAARYADGQHWDTAQYTLPEGVVFGTVRLLYQTASKEYVEFLRDNNDLTTNNGQILYDLWQQTSMSAPEVMAEVPFGGLVYLPFVVSGDN